MPSSDADEGIFFANRCQTVICKLKSYKKIQYF